MVEYKTKEEVLIAFKNFAESVCEMRRAQKAYFKSRNEKDLIMSKRIESAVDIRLGDMGLR